MGPDEIPLNYPLYQTIEQMLNHISDPRNRRGCLRLLKQNRKLFQETQGSTHNHQTWLGGYFDHVQEVMNIAVLQFAALNLVRPLPFTLSDLLLIVFLHDLEKPWRFKRGRDNVLRNRPGMNTKAAHHRFRLAKIAEYGIILTPTQKSALQYVEGELHDYSSKKRVMNPLAAVAHTCDVLSARLWFDHPLSAGDPWSQAYRIRS